MRHTRIPTRLLAYTALKLVVIGAVFLIALDNDRPLAIAIGMAAEVGAVWILIAIYRRLRPSPPRPPHPAEPYSQLQASMARLRAEEAARNAARHAP